MSHFASNEVAGQSLLGKEKNIQPNCFAMGRTLSLVAENEA